MTKLNNAYNYNARVDEDFGFQNRVYGLALATLTSEVIKRIGTNRRQILSTNYVPLLDKPSHLGGFYVTMAEDMTALMYQCIVVFLLFSCSLCKNEIPLYMENNKIKVKQ